MKDCSGGILKSNASDGLVWISNGKIIVRNETKTGMPPLINPNEKSKLFINGIECNHLSAVSESDRIEIKPLEVKTDFKLEIETSADGIKAYAYYTPAAAIKYAVIDKGPVNKLDIEVVPTEIKPKRVSSQQLIKRLIDCNIVYGINGKVLEEISSSNKPGRYLVAEGKPPEDPIDDWVECFFDENNSVEIKEDEKGNVDYKNIRNLYNVNAGQSIAKVHRGTEGTDGFDVYGNTIAARKPVQLNIVPTFSVGYDANTGIVKALRSGRPSRQIKGNNVVFQVYNTLSLDEVSIKTGNVKFKGDIEVKGNIQESMEVIAKQNVLVKGSVNFASIFAGNCITVNGSVISSKINAALNDKVAKDPAPLMEKLIDSINKLIENINALAACGEHYQFSELVRILINGRNKELPSTVYEVLNSLKTGNFDIEEDFIIEFLKKTRSLMGNFTAITDIESLQKIVHDLRSLYVAKDTMKIKGNISINSVLNSDVAALGNVAVFGNGSFNSRIYCKGRLTINSVVRGGQIRAEKGIEIGTAGAEMGVKTLLVVPQNSHIYLRTVYPDVTIKIGGVSHTFLEKKNIVRARLVSGKIVL